MSAKTAFHGKMTIFCLWKLPFPVQKKKSGRNEKWFALLLCKPAKIHSSLQVFFQIKYVFFTVSLLEISRLVAKRLKKTQHLTRQRQIIKPVPFWTATGLSKYSVGLFLPSKCSYHVQFWPYCVNSTSPSGFSTACLFVSLGLSP